MSGIETVDASNRISNIVYQCGFLCEGDSYPYDAKDRQDAANIQQALRELGFDVTLSVAARVWEEYSQSMSASWLSGADTVKDAKETLIQFCESV